MRIFEGDAPHSQSGNLYSPSCLVVMINIQSLWLLVVRFQTCEDHCSLIYPFFWLLLLIWSLFVVFVRSCDYMDAAFERRLQSNSRCQSGPLRPLPWNHCEMITALFVINMIFKRTTDEKHATTMQALDTDTFRRQLGDPVISRAVESENVARHCAERRKIPRIANKMRIFNENAVLWGLNDSILATKLQGQCIRQTSRVEETLQRGAKRHEPGEWHSLLIYCAECIKLTELDIK